MHASKSRAAVGDVSFLEAFKETVKLIAVLFISNIRGIMCAHTCLTARAARVLLGIPAG